MPAINGFNNKYRKVKGLLLVLQSIRELKVTIEFKTKINFILAVEVLVSEELQSINLKQLRLKINEFLWLVGWPLNNCILHIFSPLS